MKLIYLILILFSINISIFSESDLDFIPELREKKKYEKAILILKNPAYANNPEIEMILARVYIDNSQYKESIDLYARLCRKIGKSDCYNEYGVAQILSGYYTSAIETLKKSLSINQNSAIAHSNLAIAYYYSKQFDLSHEHYKVAIETNPTDPILKINYGVFLIHTKQYILAKQFLSSVIQEYPELFYAYLYSGIAHYMREEFNVSLNHINKAIDLNPDYFDSYYHRAVLYYKKGDYQRANLDIKKAQKIEPNNPKILQLQNLIKKTTGM